MPQHIKAKEGDVSDLVVTVGDPARATLVAGILQGSRLVNDNRSLLTYTGTYDGRRVTVAAHGLGGPSSAIVFEELFMLGARAIVRLGTAGAMVETLEAGDFIVPIGAACAEGSLRMYVPDGQLPAVPDLRLTARIARLCSAGGVRHRLGPVFSSDAFYAEDPTFVQRWARRGVVGVEMECATLFTLGLLKGFRAASLLVVSDSLVKEGESEILPADELRPYVERAAEIVLKALTTQEGSQA
jgi:5'-methylthioadenosine phosphorylase